MTGRYKIVIGVPVSQVMYSWTFMHYMRLKDTLLRDVPVITYQGPYVHMNRNLIIQQAFRDYPQFDYLLMVDSDALWPENVFERIQTYDHEQAVVAGLSFNDNPNRPLPIPRVTKSDGTGFLPIGHDEIRRMVDNPSVYKIDATGMGCTAIRRDVLEKLAETSPRWFEFTKTPQGQEVFDDIGFCTKVVDAGYSIWLDSTLIYQHVGLFPYTERFYFDYYAKPLAPIVQKSRG